MGKKQPINTKLLIFLAVFIVVASLLIGVTYFFVLGANDIKCVMQGDTRCIPSSDDKPSPGKNAVPYDADLDDNFYAGKDINYAESSCQIRLVSNPYPFGGQDPCALVACVIEGTREVVPSLSGPACSLGSTDSWVQDMHPSGITFAGGDCCTAPTIIDQALEQMSFSGGLGRIDYVDFDMAIFEPCPESLNFDPSKFHELSSEFLGATVTQSITLSDNRTCDYSYMPGQTNNLIMSAQTYNSLFDPEKEPINPLVIGGLVAIGVGAVAGGFWFFRRKRK